MCLLPPRVQAEDDTAEGINARLKAGQVVGWVIASGDTSDAALAVVYTSRLKSSQPGAFPHLVTGDLRPADTDVLGGDTDAKPAAADERIDENILVSLKAQRVLGVLHTLKTDDTDDEEVYFPGQNHRSLDALWGPDVKGWHYGVLDYGGRWDSRDVLLIETDGQLLRQTSLKAQLDARAKAYITTALKGSKDVTADSYAIAYNLQSVLPTDAAPTSAGSPLTLKIGIDAEIPKGDSEIFATMTVRLETLQGKPAAQVLKVEAAAAP